MCLRHIGDMLAVEREPGQRSGSGQWCWFEPSRPRRYADVVQRQNVGFPSRTRGFNSRYPLQPQTGAYLQFYNAGAPSDPGTWQDGVAVAQRPHKPYGGGSNPSPATIWRREKSNTEGREGTPTCVPDWNALPPMPGKPARIQPGVCRAKTAHTSKEVYPPKARTRAEGEKSPAIETGQSSNELVRVNP